ncbi:MAG TPA: hypothetical protein VFV67_15090 [Actinophytocola sp.]|uniref:hypothetical protein n=1 Tax=Actinophytocola sp. TaxID=1872138 RepID=UPI002DBC817B|nr:hypothetical protein [Actinophytocola sp.]HEU5471975.1 hypothetical protein [Actinophytocola sp.]
MKNVPMRLRHSDMLRALETIDLLDVVAHELTRRANGAAGRPRGYRLVPHTEGAAAGELTAVEDVETGQVCLMPAPSLQMICLAGLTGLASRTFLEPRVVTAAVFGSAVAAQLHLSVIARYVPNVSHAAVHPAVVESGPDAGWGLRDELELAGIVVSDADDARRAALGANLVVVAELGWERLDMPVLHPGVLLVNATRRDLPDELLAQVDHVYVDDLELMEHNQHRKFVRQHMSGSNGPDTARQHEGWHRREPRWRYQRRIDGELGNVLGDEYRPDIDDIILVELFGGGGLDVRLAGHIHQAAIKLGLGQHGNDERE